MSGNLFEVSGISLDNSISVLYGTDLPGGTSDTDNAPQGSVYFRTNGVTYKKLTSGTGSDKWAQDSVVSGITNIVSSIGSVVLDSVYGSEIHTCVWAITVTRSANPLDKQTVIISGSHNGTTAKYSQFSKLELGTRIDTVGYTVTLVNGDLQLIATLPVNCDVESYRLNAISKSGVVTLGNGSGGGDVTNTQLNTEVTNRQSGDAALDAKIAEKADITSVVNQFTTVNNNISNLNTTVNTSTTNITNIATALASEIAARQAADTALQTAIDEAVISGGGGTTHINGDAIWIGGDSSINVSYGTGLWLNDGDLSVNYGSGLALDSYGKLIATGGGGSYTLPTASSSTLGGIKVGAGLTIDGYGTVEIKYSTGLSIDGYGNLVSSGGGASYTPLAGEGIRIGSSNQSINVRYDEGLTVNDDDYLVVYCGDGLKIDTNTGKVTLKLGDGLGIDGTGALYATSGGSSGTSLSTDTQVFGFEGVVTPTIGLSRWYPYADSTLLEFYASIETSPISPIVLQLKKNGIAIGSTITISSGEFKSSILDLNVAATPTDYLTVDIVSGDSGANIFATLVSVYTATGVNANPIATTSTTGVIKIGTGLEITNDGTLNVVGSSLITPTFVDNHDFSVFIPGLISNFNGGTNVSGALVHMYMAPQAFSIDGRAYARAMVPPIADVTFNFKINNVQVGTIVFLANNPVAVCNIPATVIQAGDFLQLFSPTTTDNSISDVAVTIGSEGALAFALPVATQTTLGMVTAGANVTISNTGVLSAT